MSIRSETDDRLSVVSHDKRKVKSKPNCSNWEILMFEKLDAPVHTVVARIASERSIVACSTGMCVGVCGRGLRELVRLWMDRRSLEVQYVYSYEYVYPKASKRRDCGYRTGFGAHTYPHVILPLHFVSFRTNLDKMRRNSSTNAAGQTRTQQHTTFAFHAGGIATQDIMTCNLGPT